MDPEFNCEITFADILSQYKLTQTNSLKLIGQGVNILLIMDKEIMIVSETSGNTAYFIFN